MIELGLDSQRFNEIVRERQRQIQRELDRKSYLDKGRQIAIYRERDSGRYGDRYGQ